jgi:uncharacterized protein (TIGR02271 family)
MSRTVTAFFDSRSEAEAARDRLTRSRITAENVRIVDQGNSAPGDGKEKGFFDAMREFFLPEADRHAYGEGIGRGGFLLCARVEESQADEAIAILEESSSVDFDAREQQWRSEGWAPPASTAGYASGDPDRAVDEEHIPIVEEKLKVGKREVARGGARVRSYIRETPVHEQVSLREEHVSVERRPVDRKLSQEELARGDMLRDREIEMTETTEEAVVAKEARAREELVIKKTADERVEQIDETVRRTEVEVDEIGGRGQRPAMGFGDRGGPAPTGGTGSERGERDIEGAGYSRGPDKTGH